MTLIAENPLLTVRICAAPILPGVVRLQLVFGELQIRAHKLAGCTLHQAKSVRAIALIDCGMEDRMNICRTTKNAVLLAHCTKFVTKPQ